MKFFKRRQKIATTSVVPEEIQAYSQAEHREKMGIAALVGFISLLLTLIVLFGLFMGGKWLYGKIAGTNTKKNTTTVVEKSDSSTQNSDKKEQTPANNGETTTSPSQQSEATVPAVPATPATTNTSPAAVDPTLPRTGPDLDL